MTTEHMPPFPSRLRSPGRTALAALFALAVGLSPWTTSRAAAQSSCPLDAIGCHTADVDFQHTDVLFEEINLDSGWVPAGAPVQVRFAIYLGGQTEVEMGGTAVTSWPRSLDVSVPGRAETGRLRMNYGLEIVARIRFDVSVAGVRYDWEGDIPLPDGLPLDLRLADEAVFDPFLLPMSSPRPVTVNDDTDRFRVLNVDLTDAIIPIPGIGGGFLVDGIGSLEGSYRTERIEVSDAIGDIVEENATVVVRPDEGAAELGAAKDLTILPHGRIGYDGTITLFPTLYIRVAGRRFDLVLTDVPINVVDFETDTEFEPAEVHVPLPDIRVDPTSLRFAANAGETDEMLLTLINDGEAELSVNLGEPDGPFTTDMGTLVLAPSSSQRVPVRFSPEMGGDFNSVLLISSNDPDEPLVSVALSGNAAGVIMGDGGVPLDGGTAPPTDGGCGCRVGADTTSGTPLWVAMLALGWWARRRRRS